MNKKEHKEEVIGIPIIALGLFIFLSLISYDPKEEFVHLFYGPVQNYMGSLGILIARFLMQDVLGYFSFVIPIFIFLWGCNQLKKNAIKKLPEWTFYVFLFVLYAATIIGMIGNPTVNQESPAFEWSGGIGKYFAHTLFGLLGVGGSIIFIVVLVLMSLLLVTGTSISKVYDTIVAFFSIVYHRSRRRIFDMQTRRESARARERKAVPVAEKPAKVADTTEPAELEELVPSVPSAEPYRSRTIAIPDKGEKITGQIPTRKDSQPTGIYEFPSYELLDEPPEQQIELTWEELEDNGRVLEESLADFGVQGNIEGINPGPVITRYEIVPAPGVKVSKFVSLADDLARVMRAKRIRVVAPIPGKAAVGIELPNPNPEIVYLSELINSPEFIAASSPLTLILGKTIDGSVYTTDLREMPHLLIAGATGSGKSVCVNSIIMSILFKAHPNEVQLVMIDPKRLELAPYRQLRDHHLAWREDLDEDVITTPQNAISMLKSVLLEMERRYEMLQLAGVRNIEEYNRKVESGKLDSIEISEPFQKLEYLVLVIDELADLMMTAAKEVEEPIARLTQMSRAVGIHLIVATQRPSVDVITGVIKANFPCRIGFQVASKTDSRTILDMNGAEKLLGRGDMLFLPPGSPEPVRIHGAFVSTEEVERVVTNIQMQPRFPKMNLPVEQEEDVDIPGLEPGYERDKLFNEAAKIVVHTGQGSVSILQRRLKVGYARAARLIDELERAQIVGPFDGSKARQVLATEDTLYQMGIY
ncbi:DNA translocase FtsK 4TM domain-containing protein [candidate division KSB1 bacterium]|nr:DNA translocase FtsK 4TM domain-containing protein [candidate division KSB1 bacterium]